MSKKAIFLVQRSIITEQNTKNSLEYASMNGDSIISMPKKRCIIQMGRFHTDHGSTLISSLPMCA